VRGGTESLREIDDLLTRPDARPLKPDVRAYADRLLAIIEEHARDIDARIEGLAQNWRLSRMTSIDRNVLRLAAAEMLYLSEIPLRVSLQEAILLAEWFGTDDSRRFVNGVLDALLRELEPEQVSDTR
jgi:N utilization substance protein B